MSHVVPEYNPGYLMRSQKRLAVPMCDVLTGHAISMETRADKPDLVLTLIFEHSKTYNLQKFLNKIGGGGGSRSGAFIKTFRWPWLNLFQIPVIIQ